jgi:KDO2-lipid IV(A) lauroyltransferase
MAPKSYKMSREELLKKCWYHFLAPRFWGLWLGLGLLRLTIYLPYPILLKIGHTLGYLLQYFLVKKKRDIKITRHDVAAINLKLCFPELTEKEREVLLKKNFASLGMGIIEMGLAWWASDERLRKMVEFQGLEHLSQAKEQNKGGLYITLHFTSVELGLRLLSLAGPVAVMHRSQSNPLFEWVLQRARNCYVQQIILANDVRSLLTSLKNNSIVVYTPDQDKGRESSVFAPFFGIPAATVKATSTILKHTGAIPVVWLYYRDEKQSKYIIEISPPVNNLSTGDDIQDASELNKLFENMIRAHPEQYIWQYKRFRTRPPGAPSVY